MKLPTPVEIEDLHKKHAPNDEALQSVWTHCQIVRQIAVQVASKLSVDKDLISVGASLHDIGVYRLYKDGVLDEANYITHGLRGYELLQEEGLDEAICRFALLHTGVGITKEEVKSQNLPLPVRDYVPETQEEKIVAFADKFHSKSNPPTFNSAIWYKEHLRNKLGEYKVKLFEEMLNEFGEPDLLGLMSEYNQSVR